MKHSKDKAPDTIPITVSAYGQRVMDLKEEGHRIITAIEFYGVATNDIYKRLAKILNVSPGRAHFSTMHNEKNIRRALEVLRFIQSDFHHKLVVVPKMKEIAKMNRERQLAINAAKAVALPPKIVSKPPVPDASKRMNVKGRRGEVADRAAVDAAFKELRRRQASSI